MQKRINKILVVLVVVMFALQVGFTLMWMGAIPAGEFYALASRLAIYFPIVPFGFLQLFLCKTASRKWVSWIPPLLIIGIAVLCGVGYAVTGGWDSLIFLFGLLFCIAPALGCCLGFVVNWFWRRREYSASKRSFALGLLFSLLVVGITVLAEWRSGQGVRSMYDIPSKEEFVIACEEKGEEYATAQLAGYMEGQLHEMWGEPEGMLSGFWGDIWAIDDATCIIVYYDGGGIVEKVRLNKETAMEDRQATVMIEGSIYLVSGEGIPMEVDESAILGYANPYLESVLEEDKDRYFDPLLEMPYAKVQGDLVILYQDKWHKCTPKE